MFSQAHVCMVDTDILSVYIDIYIIFNIYDITIYFTLHMKKNTPILPPNHTSGSPSIRWEWSRATLSNTRWNVQASLDWRYKPSNKITILREALKAEQAKNTALEAELATIKALYGIVEKDPETVALELEVHEMLRQAKAGIFPEEKLYKNRPLWRKEGPFVCLERVFGKYLGSCPVKR